MDGIGLAARTLRHVLARLPIALALAFAAGAIAVFVVMLPLFVVEKLWDSAPPPHVAGQVILGAGALSAILAFVSAFRRSVEPQVPVQRPPWEVPHEIDVDETSVIGDQLFGRLDPVEADRNYPADARAGLFRDRETGQLWRSVVYFGEHGDAIHYLKPMPQAANETPADLTNLRKPRA